MIIECPDCHRNFQDEYRSTLCPHEAFAANDGKNNFAYHPEAYLSSAIQEKRMGLNDYAAEVHEANAKWWMCLKCDESGEVKATQRGGKEVWVICPTCDGTKSIIKTRNVGELLALVHSEVSEALEGHRKSLPDDKLPNRSMFEVELADTVIRIFDIAGAFGLDLEGAYREKMSFNAVRVDHSLAHRLSENGKKY